MNFLISYCETENSSIQKILYSDKNVINVIKKYANDFLKMLLYYNPASYEATEFCILFFTHNVYEKKKFSIHLISEEHANETEIIMFTRRIEKLLASEFPNKHLLSCDEKISILKFIGSPHFEIPDFRERKMIRNIRPDGEIFTIDYIDESLLLEYMYDIALLSSSNISTEISVGNKTYLEEYNDFGCDIIVKIKSNESECETEGEIRIYKFLFGYDKKEKIEQETKYISSLIKENYTKMGVQKLSMHVDLGNL